MNKRKYSRPGAATGLLVSLVVGSKALAQAYDAIIDKLVDPDFGALYRAAILPART
jgi:hypothetical protein